MTQDLIGREKKSQTQSGTSCEDTDAQREDGHGLMEAEMEEAAASEEAPGIASNQKLGESAPSADNPGFRILISRTVREHISIALSYL